MTWQKLSPEIVDALLCRIRLGAKYADLAEEYGVTTQAIAYHARRAGISRDPTKVSNLESRVIASRFVAGERATKLATEFGVSLSTVRNHVQRQTGEKPGRVQRIQKVFPPSLPTDRAYLAAIIDGEGCISMARSSGRKAWQLTVTNTSEDLRVWLEQFGGQTYYPKLDPDAQVVSKKQYYAWKVTAAWDVFRMLRSVHPYLIVKRSRSEEAMRDIEERFGIPPEDNVMPVRAAQKLLWEVAESAIHVSGSRPLQPQLRSGR